MDVRVGTFIPKEQLAVFYQKVAEENAKWNAKAGTDYPTDVSKLMGQEIGCALQRKVETASSEKAAGDAVTLSETAKARLDALQARMATAQEQEKAKPPYVPYSHLLDLPEDEFQAKVAWLEQGVLHQYPLLEQWRRDQDNSPAYKNYAKIVRDGKVIGEIDNHGYVSTTNVSIGLRWAAIFNEGHYDGTNLTGPALAQHLAEMFVKMFGGEIQIQDTAQTQKEFEATPPVVVHCDEAAAHQDPAWAELQQLKQARKEKYGDHPPGTADEGGSAQAVNDTV